jgi:hypothetical protein
MAGEGRANRERGNVLEREVVKRALSFGLVAHRSWGSNGRAQGLHEEVDVVVEGVPLQCKRKKKLAAYIIPGKHVAGQVVREDHGKPLITIPLDAYLALLKTQKEHADHDRKERPRSDGEGVAEVPARRNGDR